MFKRYIKTDNDDIIIDTMVSEKDVEGYDYFETSIKASFTLDLMLNNKYKYQFVGNLETNDTVFMQGETGYIIESNIKKYSKDIDFFKDQKKLIIDNNTRTLIFKGFNYDNRHFSLSTMAQSTWTNLSVNRDLFSFPIELTAQDGDGKYYLAKENVDAFIGSGLMVVKDALDSGRLKTFLLDNSNDIDDVYNFIDDRNIT